jgi:hypothetical protein
MDIRSIGEKSEAYQDIDQLIRGWVTTNFKNEQLNRSRDAFVIQTFTELASQSPNDMKDWLRDHCTTLPCTPQKEATVPLEISSSSNANKKRRGTDHSVTSRSKRLRLSATPTLKQVDKKDLKYVPFT